MKIGIDSGALVSGHSIRGVGVYTSELLNALQLLKKDRSISIEAVDFKNTDLSKYDVLHYTSFNPFFITLPFQKKNQKIVVTIHDLIPLLYPKHYPAGVRGKLKFLIQKYLVKNVDAVITDSETSKKDIIRFLGVDPQKIHVVYLAPKIIFKPIKDQELLGKIMKKYNLPNTFVLYVGDVNYNKNIPSLIKATKLAKMQLVIVGKHALDVESQGMGINDLKGPKDWLRFIFNKAHPELVHYKRILKSFDDNILRLGFVPDEDINQIYNLATFYCQPSYYEGFGLPVLEAFASGTAVAAARTQALVEIGGEACLYFDPKNVNEMVNVFKKIVRNKVLKQKLIDLGSKQVEQYTWSTTANKTLEVYKNVLS